MIEEIYTVWGSTHESLERALALGQHYVSLGQAEKALEWIEPHLHQHGNQSTLNPIEAHLADCARAARQLLGHA